MYMKRHEISVHVRSALWLLSGITMMWSGHGGRVIGPLMNQVELRGRRETLDVYEERLKGMVNGDDFNSTNIHGREGPTSICL